jgi:Tol biopolymer transport system component
VATVSTDATPRLLAPAIDLLVKPLWSADSKNLVYRRSTVGAYALAISPVDGGEERVIASSGTSALFPVAFSKDGTSVYYVAVDESAGSRLMSADLASGVSDFVATLSLGLTRDWSLSPDGEKVAYLEIGIGADEVTSRALVYQIGAEKPEAVTDRTLAAFGPVWSPDGDLIVGALDETKGVAALLRVGASRALIEVPKGGFEVPLAVAGDGESIVVRSFDNPSSFAPGRSSLALAGADGSRQTIATGEVTFVGWTNP